MINKILTDLKNKNRAGATEDRTARLIKEQEELLKSNIVENTIKVGDRLPDFNVVDTSGNCYTKDSFKGKKLVLNFFRGSW